MALKAQPRRVTLVADEILGYVRTGGIGTATTFLALGLARLGHDVDVLYYGPEPKIEVAPEWAGLYEVAGVRITIVPVSDAPVEPSYFARMRDVEVALRADPPDVVVAQDLGAPAYIALRLKQLGLAFEHTLFVVYCHGTRQWITEMARKVRVLPGALAITLLEQASVELADVAVSPSAYVVDWMRRHGWRPPERTLVIPYLSRSGVTDEPAPRPAALDKETQIERLAFFGRLEERKGLTPFLAGLNSLDPELLDGIELDFVGRATPAWTPARIESLLFERTRSALRSVSFATELDQHEALARLRRPGTVAVMPSLGETFSNAVRECLEYGIPFLSSNAGAPPELVAAEDRERVLFEPTPEGVAAVLTRTLATRRVPQPARPAFDDAASLERWAEVIALKPSPRAPAERPEIDVIVDADREAGLRAGRAPWVVFLDPDDVPAEGFVEVLARAQAASGADVVTCGLWVEDAQGRRTQRLFLGEPKGLGVLENGYGAVALLRRSLLEDVAMPWPVEGDPDWPLLAGLSAAGARIVSIPAPLVTRRVRPGTVEAQPAEALLVLERLEPTLPQPVRGIARLAAGLAAGSHIPATAHGRSLRSRVSQSFRRRPS